MPELEQLRQKLVLEAARLDREVPDHGFDSGLMLAGKAGGLLEAVSILDEHRRLGKESLKLKRKNPPATEGPQ